MFKGLQQANYNLIQRGFEAIRSGKICTKSYRLSMNEIGNDLSLERNQKTQKENREIYSEQDRVFVCRSFRSSLTIQLRVGYRTTVSPKLCA